MACAITSVWAYWDKRRRDREGVSSSRCDPARLRFLGVARLIRSFDAIMFDGRTSIGVRFKESLDATPGDFRNAATLALITGGAGDSSSSPD